MIMNIPVSRMRHNDVAIALIAAALETFDGGVPTNLMEPRLDQIYEDGETNQLIAALAYLGASLASTASQAAVQLGKHLGVDTDDLTPEGILATILQAATDPE